MSAGLKLGLGVAATILALILLALLGRGMGLRWDPLRLEARRIERLETELAQSRAEARARSLEVEGERGQARRAEAATGRTRAAERAVEDFNEERTADAASLDPDRLERLRRLDDELCRIAEDLAGCAAAPEPAGSGQPSL